MNLAARVTSLATTCVLASLIGCSSPNLLASFRAKHAASTDMMLAEKKDANNRAAKMASGGPAEQGKVHQTSATEPLAPSLMTLPPGSDLDDAISQSPGPVLLDFYADWCGPCRQQGKILHDMESIAAQSQTQIIKINVDDHPELAKRMNVASLPTLVMLKDGKVIQRQTGVADQQRLVSWLK